VEIGDKISRQKLTELGWTMTKEIRKASCEIWENDTQRLIWRVKTEMVYLMWDNKLRYKSIS
jgi:hypothetical protein